MDRKYGYFIFIVIIETIFCFYIYNKSIIDFNIDYETIAKIPVSIYKTYDEVIDTAINNQSDSTDYNKLYYYQRVELAHKIAEAEASESESGSSNQTTQSQRSITSASETDTQQVQTGTLSLTTDTLVAVTPTGTIDPTQYQELLAKAEEWLGTPYVWGGTSITNGADCSGFVQSLYRSIGVNLKRTSAEQSKEGLLVSRHELLPGDLLFFDTTNPRDSSDILTPTEEMLHAEQIEDGYVPNVISHVGMYVGNGQMIHAASGQGYIKYEDIEVPYYQNRFINARRILVPQIK